jgi:hypothetical protein
MYYIIILLALLVLDFKFKLHILEILLGIIITLIFYMLSIISYIHDLYMVLKLQFHRYLSHID